MNPDPFAQFRPKSQPAIATDQPSNAVEQPEDIFSSYRPKIEAPKQESLPQNIGRQAVRTGSRIAETILGAPRAFGEFAESLIPEKLLTKGAEKIGLKEPVEKGFQLAKEYAPYKLFPTSEQVKDISSTLFGKSVKPKNEWEKKADTLITDFTALALPLPATKFKVLKPGLLALGGNVASEIVGKMGGGEKQKDFAKLGTFLLGSLVKPAGAKKFADELYAKARDARPADAKVNATNLENSAITMYNNLLVGSPTSPSKSKSFELLNQIVGKIKNRNIDINELEKFKIDINEARAGLYDQIKDKPGRKLAKSYLNQVSNIVDQSLSEYGKTNPQWEAYYRPANEVFGSIAQSNKARNFIQRNLGKVSPHLTAGLFGLGHGGAKTLTGLAQTAALTGGIVESGALISRIMKSKTLRKYYYGVVENALKENAVAMRDNLRKLEQELEKENQSQGTS